MRKFRLPADSFEFIPCEGGCDFVTPTMLQPKGRLRECRNLEIGVSGGYEWGKGYERYDGRAAPSAATYTVLAANITGTVAVGNTVTGATSAATGYVIAVEASAIIVTQVSGTFVNGENVTVSAVVQATLTAAPALGGASTAALNAEYTNLAADVYRTLITTVTGSGKIRGVCRYNGVLYAWRTNAGGTAMAIYKSSGSGWTAVALGRELSFTGGGTYVIAEGDTITGATSAATAVITRVVLESGDWTTGDAAGRLIFASQTGTFQAENLNVGANLNVATIAGNSAAITLAANGRVKHVIENFGGATGTRRVYGCDGVNRGFEFDGTVYAPIATGMTTDTPSNVAAHKNQLFFGFGSSLQHSAPGQPYVWDVIVGAAELAMGDNITCLSRETGSTDSGALGVWCRNSGGILYGNDVEDWNLVRFRPEVGAIANSTQDAGFTIRLDDRGFASTQATDVFGNFEGSTLSTLVNPWVQQRKTTLTDSCIVREKNQYRAFFDDETALYITFLAGKVIGCMTQQLAHKIECIHSVEKSDGNEEIFFGSDDGYCYQMEKGTSHDGTAIEYYGMLNYWHCKTPRVEKSFFGATVEARGSGYAEFSLGYELGYSASHIYQPTSQATAASFQDQVNFREGRWDVVGDQWDDGYWDGVSISPSEFELCGDAENIAFILYAQSDEFLPVNFSGINVRHKVRRVMQEAAA